jgi:hypothetical protein
MVEYRNTGIVGKEEYSRLRHRLWRARGDRRQNGKGIMEYWKKGRME